jgi:hypothetical protein
MYHALTGLGALPASILFGVVYSTLGARGGRVAFLCGAGLAFTAMILLIFLVREAAPLETKQVRNRDHSTDSADRSISKA